MSLILEALRKSEAERRRAAAPDLHAPVAAPPRRQPVLGPVLATVAGFALLAGTWVVSRPPAPVASPTPGDVPEPSVSAPTGARDEVAAPTAPTDRPVAADDAAGSARATPMPRPARAPSPAAPPERVEQPAPAAAVAPPPPRHETIAAETVPVTAPPPESSSPPADALPGLDTLAPGERAALPPLKLSMHVWSPDPARRFAIVDGQRVTEGALLGGGTVAEIRPDGLVLDVAGRRVLLPRP